MPILDDGYRIDLEHYSGPLDLLLYLVRRHEIDLKDIPIAKLTDQYLDHLQKFEQFDVNTAGEFLVMAATLLEIKSAMLLPRDAETEPCGEGADESQDPRYDLVRQLLAYKKYKDAASELLERQAAHSARFARPGIVTNPIAPDGGDLDQESEGPGMELDDVDLGDLCHSFVQILATIGSETGHEVVYDDTPIALHAEDICDRLYRDGPMTLQAIFVGRHSRSEMIGLFLAVLELVRQSRINVIQNSAEGAINLSLRDTSGTAEEPADRTLTVGIPADADTGTRVDPADFEWPDEETRLRAEQRALRRRQRLENRDFVSDNEFSSRDTAKDEDNTSPQEMPIPPAG